MDDRKICEKCGSPFVRRREGKERWNARRFCSRACGAPSSEVWTPEVSLEAIRMWVRRTGDVPRRIDFHDDRRLPSPSSLVRVWGSVGEAIRAAGFEPRPWGAPSNLVIRQQLGRNRQMVTGQVPQTPAGRIKRLVS